MTESLDKNQIRKTALKVRESLSASHRSAAETRISEFLNQLCDELKLNHVASYQPMRSEVSLEEWHQQSSVKLSYPKVNGDSLQFLTPNRPQDFQLSSWGVREPVPEKSIPSEISMLEAIIVPGLAFDRRGYRLGYGRGFYDRALASYLGLKIGVGFRAQLIPEDLPVERHDLQMDYLLTEDFIIAAVKH